MSAYKVTGGEHMRLSTKGRYGTRAIIEIAKEYGGRPVKRRDIVEAQGIPDSYLENILIALKAAGLVRTIRGAHGGYQLAKDPTEITILDVVQALEGSIAPVHCLEEYREVCRRSKHCPTQSIWNEMYEAMEEVLKKYTLEEVLLREQEPAQIDYVI
jgi:Rrf2 family protein